MAKGLKRHGSRIETPRASRRTDPVSRVARRERVSEESQGPRKTLIGILAARDSELANETLISVFEHLCHHAKRSTLEKFHFVMTGGTHDRVFGHDVSERGDKDVKVLGVSDSTADWLHNRCGVTRLRSARDGGVTILSYLITQQQCSIVWPFFAAEHHWLRPENLAFMRLCDQWHVKRLMNAGSVLVWYDKEAESDTQRNLQKTPPQLRLRPDRRAVKLVNPHTRANPSSGTHRRADASGSRVKWTPEPRKFGEMTIALIAHDQMKSRMIEFAIDHKAELERFGTILATGTTGREVAAATSEIISKKLYRYHSGPKGGDIEIATEILYGGCDVVIFFVDPLNPHAHIEDIRTVFQTCMLYNEVVMITNEMHAREFMTRVVRGSNKGIDIYRAPKA